jgi:hypothetical protein
MYSSFGIFLAFFSLSGDPASTPENVMQFELEIDDDTPNSIEKKFAKYGECLQIYAYKSTTNLHNYYSVWLSPKQGKILSEQYSVLAEIKNANDDDPSIKLYMSNGPIRFYLPTGDIDALPQPSWRYKNCVYHILDTTRIYEFDADKRGVTNNKFLRALVESRCDDSPQNVVRYLYDELSGLFAITFGKISGSGNGESTFQLSESYFIRDTRYGFGISRPCT